MKNSVITEKLIRFAEEKGVDPLLTGQSIRAAFKILYDFLVFCDGDFEGMEEVNEAINAITVCCKKLFL